MATLHYPGRLIRKGEKDKAVVSQIQTRLRQVGCGSRDRDHDGKPEELIVDGDFGAMTDEAVRIFQARFSDDDARMDVDGVVGPTTWGALFGLPSAPQALTADADILKRMLAVAATQVGIKEKPLGSNAGPEVEDYLKSVGLGKGNPWCAAFVYWCFAKAAAQTGAANPCVKTGHVLTSWANAKPSQRITSAQAKNDPSLIKPGLVFIMDTGAPGGAGHTGIVEKVIGGTIHTIEGNTNEAGSREGTGVFRKTSRRVSAESINKGFLDYSK
jgi:hypothetical protein